MYEVICFHVADKTARLPQFVVVIRPTPTLISKKYISKRSRTFVSTEPHLTKYQAVSECIKRKKKKRDGW